MRKLLPCVLGAGIGLSGICCGSLDSKTTTFEKSCVNTTPIKEILSRETMSWIEDFNEFIFGDETFDKGEVWVPEDTNGLVTILYDLGEGHDELKAVSALEICERMEANKFVPIQVKNFYLELAIGYATKCEWPDVIKHLNKYFQLTPINLDLIEVDPSSLSRISYWNGLLFDMYMKDSQIRSDKGVIWFPLNSDFLVRVAGDENFEAELKGLAYFELYERLERNTINCEPDGYFMALAEQVEKEKRGGIREYLIEMSTYFLKEARLEDLAEKIRK